MGALLEVNDLKKYFKTPKGTLHAVDGISFSLDAGKTLGVVGESGCEELSFIFWNQQVAKLYLMVRISQR